MNSQSHLYFPRAKNTGIHHYASPIIQCVRGGGVYTGSGGGDLLVAQTALPSVSVKVMGERGNMQPC